MANSIRLLLIALVSGFLLSGCHVPIVDDYGNQKPMDTDQPHYQKHDPNYYDHEIEKHKTLKSILE